MVLVSLGHSNNFGAFLCFLSNRGQRSVPGIEPLTVEPLVQIPAKVMNKILIHKGLFEILHFYSTTICHLILIPQF